MKIYLLLLCCLSIDVAKADDLEGYIVKKTGDTVKGIIDVPIYKKALNTKREIMFADMWSEIKFGEGSAKKKKVNATEVAGFGFIHQGQWYHFISLDLQKNYGQKAPKMVAKAFNDLTFFIHRVEDAPVQVCKEYAKSPIERESSVPGYNRKRVDEVGYEYYEILWIKNTDGMFIEAAPVALSGKKSKFKYFLTDVLKLEEEFVNTVNDKKDYEDADEVLKQYNEWKKTK